MSNFGDGGGDVAARAGFRSGEGDRRPPPVPPLSRLLVIASVAKASKGEANWKMAPIMSSAVLELFETAEDVREGGGGD